MNETTLMLPEPAKPTAIGQALLFSRDVELAVEKEERDGRYTLERFRKLRKSAFDDCVALLAAAKPGYEGLRRIAGIVGVHHLTVAAVRDDVDAGKTIDTLRERLSKKMLTAVEMLADRVLESPGAIPAGMIGMVIDQLTKNAELLGNRATQRTEHTERLDIYADWDEILEKRLEPGDVREVGAETGFAGGNVSAIEAAPSGDPGELRDQANAGSDAQSPGPATDRPAKDHADTTSATDPNGSAADPEPRPTAPDVRNEGGRGSSSVEGGGQTRSGYNKRNFPGNGPLPARTSI